MVLTVTVEKQYRTLNISVKIRAIFLGHRESVIIVNRLQTIKPIERQTGRLKKINITVRQD